MNDRRHESRLLHWGSDRLYYGAALAVVLARVVERKVMAPALKSVAEELADCRKAFDGIKTYAPTWHLSKYRLWDFLIQPIEYVTAQYVIRWEPESEHPLLLRLMRPARDVEPLFAIYFARCVGREWNGCLGPGTFAVAQHYWRDRDSNPAQIAARMRLEAEMAALHAIQCPDCPWDCKLILRGEPKGGS